MESCRDGAGRETEIFDGDFRDKARLDGAAFVGTWVEAKGRRGTGVGEVDLSGDEIEVRDFL